LCTSSSLASLRSVAREYACVLGHIVVEAVALLQVVLLHSGGYSSPLACYLVHHKREYRSQLLAGGYVP
ncbi:TPA: hypothetical protein ACHVDM_002113, partial [Streptococcus suis]